ncbi:Coenzyme F420 hydrogenase/dehydrogenase, beta subunit C-terminal domain [Kordiimonas sp. SCSIO 12610]|uniref:Coenzyme F420 hydrogenase/dehydrogenase, beta subunit C-terminal domain n=1 Tax=Kordiimonas sp. SCSIO 12610 TaxID=2829597 RepID=UPI00210BE30A|nr:Coenzyme F420 hydrogenase/dehydrogenase, beta subunit C-terminal domain [Kordiimonas sp. SCSIO 12610]UTW55864.1 Coenzyme F420 hydrogenase/dehydrogenase, beta subunit C-terminal domain [Kordiimonas sp. SCSIO 12610]
MSKLEHIILKNDLCVGCGLCETLGVNEGVKMGYNHKGFLRPQLGQTISKKLDDQIYKVCPGITLEADVPESEQHLYWGPVLDSFTGYAKDEAARFAGSSGGGLSAILLYYLESGQADVVIQTAASEKDPIINDAVLSNKAEEVIKAAGSRYSPAAPLSRLLPTLEKYDRIVVVGKPCDIAGLTNFLRDRTDLESKVVLKLAFMCGGTPSQSGTHEILQRLKVDHADLTSFRYRGEGWPGNVQAHTKDGRCETMSYPVSWGEILTNTVQFRCKICADATGAFSDITFADAWYDDGGGMPSFDEQAGRSLILARTDRGLQALNNAKKFGTIQTDPLAIEEVAKMQPYHVLRKQLVMSRLIALRLGFRVVPSYKKLRLREAAMQAGIKKSLKSFLGMMKRVILRKV